MKSPNFFKLSAPVEFTDALRTYCKKHDIPISTLVRHAVREYIERRHGSGQLPCPTEPLCSEEPHIRLEDAYRAWASSERKSMI